MDKTEKKKRFSDMFRFKRGLLQNNKGFIDGIRILYTLLLELLCKSHKS